MWKQNKGNWEYIAIDEPEGQIVVKVEEPKERVIIDVPEGQVVLKKGRKPRKKNEKAT